MAVEAGQLNLFPPRILSNRELMMNSIQGIGNVYGTPTGYGGMAPLSGTGPAMDTVVPVYAMSMSQTVPARTWAIKSDSGLTYAVPASRKRSRDEALNFPASSLPVAVQNQNVNNRCGSFTFLGEDFSFQFLQQQLEIDGFIAQHTEKVRTEIEERRKRHCRRIAAAIEEIMLKKLKAKEEEIVKIGKLNFALEERMKSLCVENQILKDLAQTNEATANALRCNLEHVLAQVQDEQQQHQHQHQHRGIDAALADDAQSCCGSNVEDNDRRRAPAECSRDRDGSEAPNSRMCRKCGEEESCVLLLPCRHLCLCTACGSSLHTCPVCSSAKTASVRVNLNLSAY